MFWGLIIEPSKRYSQVIAKSFHLSMASLDISKSDDKPVQVMLLYQNCTYLLCTLQKDTQLQMSLDLNFQEGTKICFSSNGNGNVHLTGYVIPESEDEFDMNEDEESILDRLSPKKRQADGTASQKKLKKQKLLNDSNEDNSSDDDDEEMSDLAFDDSDEDESFDVEDEDSDNEENEQEEEEEEEEEDEEEEEAPKLVEEKKLTKSQKRKLKKLKAKENEKLANGKSLNESKVQDKSMNGESPDKSKKQKNKDKKKNEEKSESPATPKKKVIEGGILVEELKVGSGPVAKSGKFISVYYVGKLKNGKKFDQTSQGDGFKFRLGSGEVIKGWDLGIAGMKVGGKRRLIIPPPMAYGSKGSPPVIPANSTLYFDVELKALH